MDLRIIDARERFLKKLENCKKLIEDFEDESKTTIFQWYNFKEYFISELNALKNDYFNKIRAEKITIDRRRCRKSA